MAHMGQYCEITVLSKMPPMAAITTVASVPRCAVKAHIHRNAISTPRTARSAEPTFFSSHSFRSIRHPALSESVQFSTRHSVSILCKPIAGAAKNLLTIVTVFSAHLYGKPSPEFRQKTKQLIDEMEGGEARVTVVKTVKIGIHKELHAVKRQAILAARALYNRTIMFYLEFFVGHLAVLDAKKKDPRRDGTPDERPWTNQEWLTFAETHTLDTKTHPYPLHPLIETLPSARTIPVSLRRAAINHATRKVKSW